MTETANIRSNILGGYVGRIYKPKKERDWDSMLKAIQRAEQERVLIVVKTAKTDTRKQVEVIDEHGKKKVVDNKTFGRMLYETIDTFELEAGTTGKQAAEELRKILSGVK